MKKKDGQTVNGGEWRHLNEEDKMRIREDNKEGALLSTRKFTYITKVCNRVHFKHLRTSDSAFCSDHFGQYLLRLAI